MSDLELLVRRVSQFDFGCGSECESELRRLLATPLRSGTASAARSVAPALHSIVKLAASPPPSAQRAAQLFSLCFAATTALDQLRPALNASKQLLSAADVTKLQFNLAVQAIAAQQVRRSFTQQTKSRQFQKSEPFFFKF
jgi:hypothetical protein